MCDYLVVNGFAHRPGSALTDSGTMPYLLMGGGASLCAFPGWSLGTRQNLVESCHFAIVGRNHEL